MLITANRQFVQLVIALMFACEITEQCFWLRYVILRVIRCWAFATAAKKRNVVHEIYALVGNSRETNYKRLIEFNARLHSKTNKCAYGY